MSDKITIKPYYYRNYLKGAISSLNNDLVCVTHVLIGGKIHGDLDSVIQSYAMHQVAQIDN